MPHRVTRVTTGRRYSLVRFDFPDDVPGSEAPETPSSFSLGPSASTLSLTHPGLVKPRHADDDPKVAGRDALHGAAGRYDGLGATNRGARGPRASLLALRRRLILRVPRRKQRALQHTSAC